MIRKLNNVIDILDLFKGGEGSGNFGHSGRQGQVGGSSKINEEFLGEMTDKYHQIQNLSYIEVGEAVRGALGKNTDEIMEKAGRGALNNTVTYTASSFEDVNNHLRGKDVGIEASRAFHIASYMDKAFEHASIPHNIIAYRGIGEHSYLTEMPIEYLEGRVYNEKAFTSTSIDKEKLEKFGEYADIYIKIPTGSKALYLEKITQVKGEEEVLINRGANFLIESAIDNPETKKREIVMTLLSS